MRQVIRLETYHRVVYCEGKPSNFDIVEAVQGSPCETHVRKFYVISRTKFLSFFFVNKQAAHGVMALPPKFFFLGKKSTNGDITFF
jgi:hypothetical protein